MKSYITSAFAVAMSAATLSVTDAAYIPIYGGPSAVQTGSTLNTFSVLPNSVGDGVAVFYRSTTASGTFANRITTTGGVQTLNSLGSVSGGTPNSSVFAVSAGGVAIGQSSEASSSSSSRAVYWAAGSSTPTQLDSLTPVFATIPGQSTGRANAINAGGLIVGQSQKYVDAGYTGAGTRAVYWASGSTTPTELGNLGTSNGVNDNTGTTTASAVAVNTVGTIVGNAFNYDLTNRVGYGSHAVRWASGSTAAIDLGVINTGTGTSSGNASSAATAINTGGTVIGSGTRYDVTRYQNTTNPLNGYSLGTRALRWSPTDVTPTELLPLNTTAYDVTNQGRSSSTTVYAGTGAATANDINDLGTTVGVSTLYARTETAATSGSGLLPATYGNRAVRWDTGSTTAVPLAVLDKTVSATGTTNSTANAVNNAGLIVGTANVTGSTSVYDAVVWYGGGTQIVDLNTLIDPSLGWVLTSATSISETNWVTGLGTLNGTTAAFLLQVPSAVPEPTTLAALGGLAVIGLRRRRNV